jgi:hypothetical protein
MRDYPFIKTIRDVVFSRTRPGTEPAIPELWRSLPKLSLRDALLHISIAAPLSAAFSGCCGVRLLKAVGENERVQIREKCL